MCTAQDMLDISEHLPDIYKAPLSDHLKKCFECEFHSASYHLMVDIFTALRTVLGHLIKALEPVNSNEHELQSESAVGFMSKLYNQHGEVLQKIGVQSANSAQISCLAELPLTSTYSCLELFFHWLDEGFYDFSDMPFPFKVHLGKEEEKEIEKLCVRRSAVVLEELQQLVDLLKQSEKDITSHVNEVIDVSIYNYVHRI